MKMLEAAQIDDDLCEKCYRKAKTATLRLKNLESGNTFVASYCSVCSHWDGQ